MGQKTHPIGFRIGVTKPWLSRWYTEKNFGDLIQEDFKVRRFVKQKLYGSGVSKIELERAASKLRINVHAARPGIAIGKKGAGIEQLRGEIAHLLRKPTEEVFLNITEVRKAEADATLVAESIANQIERRVAYRRAMKKAIQQAKKYGVKGVKIRVSGRLAGAEIARSDKYSEGSIPLHTLRADIDYGFAEAKTTYGIIGIKVWINKGEVDMRSRLGRSRNSNAAVIPATNL
ncbi:MAG: 30S ribosomal protein S3 [Proteobacteria bacterium]|jgi:small subunit ribosomal protein S3|nr:30S ribosomal protein S3 [Pseudomonadota bacterium]